MHSWYTDGEQLLHETEAMGRSLSLPSLVNSACNSGSFSPPQFVLRHFGRTVVWHMWRTGDCGWLREGCPHVLHLLLFWAPLLPLVFLFLGPVWSQEFNSLILVNPFLSKVVLYLLTEAKYITTAMLASLLAFGEELCLLLYVWVSGIYQYEHVHFYARKLLFPLIIQFLGERESCY